MVLPVSDCECTELTPGSPPSLSHSLLLGAYDFRHSSASLAILAANRPASSLLSNLAADRRPGSSSMVRDSGRGGRCPVLLVRAGCRGPEGRELSLIATRLA